MYRKNYANDKLLLITNDDLILISISICLNNYLALR